MFPVTLTTERLVLREFEEEDASAANAYESREDVMRYQTHEPRTLDESRDYIRRVRAEARLEPRRVYDFAVVARAGERVVGRAGFGVDARDPRQAMIWYVLHPDLQGQGLATEAARAVVGFAFEELGLHRVWADVDPRNVPSVRVCERLGMRREAHHVESDWQKGEWTDSFIFALLAREWRVS